MRFNHVNEMENFNVGEKVLLTLMGQPDNVKQIPDGFDIDQYFIISPDSKFLKINKTEFVLEREKGKSIKLEKIRQLVSKFK